MFHSSLSALVDSIMVAIELFRITLVICAHQNLSLSLAFQKICVLYLRSHDYYLTMPIFMNLPRMKGLNIEEHHRVNNINAIYNMAKQGMGATLIFSHTIEKELTEGTLVDLMPHQKLPEILIYLMYHKFNYTPEKMRAFIDFFKLRDLSAN